MWDEETKLRYLRTRYYEPETGRFISRDSYPGELENPLSMHLYAYVQNNPLRYVDPTGHTFADFVEGVRREVNANYWLIPEDDEYTPTDPNHDLAGRLVGDFIVTASGVVEYAAGSTTAAGSGAFAVVTSPTGVGIAVGGAGVVAGAAVAGLGVVHFKEGSDGFIDNASKLIKYKVKSNFDLFRNFDYHFEKYVLGKHGGKKEFGNISKAKYHEMALDLATSKADGKNIFSRTLSGGREAVYKKSTNELVIIHNGKEIGTYFKPTNGWKFFQNLK